MKQFFITTTLSQYLQENNLQFLLEIIYSLQNVFIVSEEEFQVWIFKRAETNKFILELQDGNLNKILQVFYISDNIKIDEVKVWFENSTLFFPSER